MPYEKNVASQKVGFVMVDKTDFASPETGISPSAVIRKDGGASAALSNTVSELTNGQYVVTLSQGETNADLLQLRFHDSAASCASQFIVIATDKGKLASILADTATITDVRGDTTSILNDTRTLSNATYGLDALETIVSAIAASIGTGSALSASISSIQEEIDNATYGLNALESLCSQILEDTTSILVDTTTTIPGTITTLENRSQSILADTITLSNASYGLDALETLCSQILQDTGTTIPATVTTLENRSQSILADTITLSNATYGLDALETIVSDILEGMVHATYGLDALESLCSNIYVDTAAISNINTDDFSGVISDILEDTAALATTVNAQVADVLKTDTLTEPAQGAPGVNISMEAKIAWLYKFMRNKITNDGTDIKVYNDAEAVVDHKAPVAEAAGTVTRGEFVTGP